MGHSYNSGATPRKSTGSLSMMAGGGRSSTISSHLNGEKRDSPQLQHARLVLYFVSWSLAPEKLEGPMEFSRLWKKTKKESEIAQLCPTLCDPMDCSLPGSSVHGILQARILEWVAISFSKGIFPTQGLNLGLPHCRQTLYHLSRQGSPSRLWGNKIKIWVSFHMGWILASPQIPRSNP